MAHLLPHELELLRRSVAMLPPGAPNGLDREKALQIISQLKDVTAERDRLGAALGASRGGGARAGRQSNRE